MNILYEQNTFARFERERRVVAVAFIERGQQHLLSGGDSLPLSHGLSNSTPLEGSTLLETLPENRA